MTIKHCTPAEIKFQHNAYNDDEKTTQEIGQERCQALQAEIKSYAMDLMFCQPVEGDM